MSPPIVWEPTLTSGLAYAGLFGIAHWGPRDLPKFQFVLLWNGGKVLARNPTIKQNCLSPQLKFSIIIIIVHH